MHEKNHEEVLDPVIVIENKLDFLHAKKNQMISDSIKLFQEWAKYHSA